MRDVYEVVYPQWLTNNTEWYMVWKNKEEAKTFITSEYEPNEEMLEEQWSGGIDCKPFTISTVTAMAVVEATRHYFETEETKARVQWHYPISGKWYQAELQVELTIEAGILKDAKVTPLTEELREAFEDDEDYSD